MRVLLTIAVPVLDNLQSALQSIPVRDGTGTVFFVVYALKRFDF